MRGRKYAANWSSDGWQANSERAVGPEGVVIFAPDGLSHNDVLHAVSALLCRMKAERGEAPMVREG